MKSPLSIKNALKRDWLYTKLTSLRTSIYILALMSFFYLLGTIFPQGGKIEDYIEAGGRYVWAVRVFDLLELFTSPVFIIASILLLLNLTLCTYDRLKGLIYGKKTPPKSFSSGHTIALTLDKEEAEDEVLGILRNRLGFRVLSLSGDWKVLEKGLSYRWLTLLYHAGIAACFIGFFLTYLFAIEDTVTLKPKEPATLTPKEPGRLASLWKDKGEPLDFQIMLLDFKTEYVQSPDLKYPDDAVSRLALALGWQSLSYELKDDSLFPKDWKAKLRVIRNRLPLYEKTIEVNDPLKYGGYTFYLMDFDYTLRIRVDDNPLTLEVKAGDELMVPGLDEPLRFGPLRTGTLFRLDGGKETITPFTVVKRSKKGTGGGKHPEELGRLELGGTLLVDGRRISLVDFAESVTLSYRHDPGVGLLWWGGLFVFVIMSLRCLGGWYLLAYRIEESEGIAYLVLSITTKGLGASEERVVKRLEHYIMLSEIKPTPLPPA